MKNLTNHLPTTAALLLLSFCGFAQAATVTAEPPSSGISYQWGLSLGGTDSGTVSGAVGQWSWEDPNVPGGAGGWGHTSHWIAVTLTEPARLQLVLGRDPEVAQPAGGFYPVSNYYPSFTIWQNQDLDPAPLNFLESPELSGNWPTYPNDSNVPWAEDLVYLDHFRNSGTGETASGTWDLAAGQYTLAVGGLAPAADGASRQGYAATFSTQPIPEPGAGLLGAVAMTGMLFRRRRSLR